MRSDYERGLREGLKFAATLCDRTASELDQAASECETQGDRETSDLTGVGAVYVRHTAARIRAAALDGGSD